MIIIRNTFSLVFFTLYFCLQSAQIVEAQNYSLSFDGVNDRVTVPHHSAYNLGLGDFTLEAVVNLPANNSFYVPIMSSRTGASDGFLLLYASSGSAGNTVLLAQMNGVPNEVSTTFASIRDGNCHHLAVKRAGSSGAFYVDGVQKGAFAFSHAGINSTGPLYFGYDIYDNTQLDGTISEVRMWSLARTQTEIQTYMNSPVPNNSTGLIGLWRMNELQGQVVVDSSATKNNGYLGNSSSADPMDPARTSICMNGDNIVFDGTQDAEESTSLNISPTPFTGEVKLSLNQALSSGASIEVYNMKGVLMFSHPLDATSDFVFGENFPKGIYVVKLIDGSVVRTAKMLKE